MTTFTARAVLPVPRTESFDFVTNPENWPRFIRSAESVREVHDWGAVGGRARVAGRFLGRSVAWEAEIVEWLPPATFRYRLRRPGLPELVNTRVFDEAAGGTALTAVTGLALRSGIRGLRDRVDVALVRRSTVRALRDLEALLGGRAPGVGLVEVTDGVHRCRRDNVNWYVIEADDGLTLVDAGLPAHLDELTAHLERTGRSAAQVRAVLITHGHPDHVGMAEALRRQGAAVYVHAGDADTVRAGVPVNLPERFVRNLWRPRVLRVLAAWVRAGMRPWRASRDRPIVPAVGLTLPVHDGEVIDAPGCPRPVYVPGHTPGSVAYIFEKHSVVCTGDALVTQDAVTGRQGAGVSPTGLNVDDRQALESVRRLAVDRAVVLPGHGEPHRIGAPDAVRTAVERGADW